MESDPCDLNSLRSAHLPGHSFSSDNHPGSVSLANLELIWTGPSFGGHTADPGNSLLMIMCFLSLFVLQPPSSCDWLTSLLIPSYHFTSFWKDVHGVSLLDNNIALLVLLFYVRGEFRSSGQPSAVSNLHRHSGKTTEESQKEKDYFRNP